MVQKREAGQPHGITRIHKLRIHKTVAKPNFNVRISEEQRAELQELADQNGVEISQLIRWALDALLRHAKAHDGRLLLPLNFEETWAVHKRGGKARLPGLKRAKASAGNGTRSKRAK